MLKVESFREIGEKMDEKMGEKMERKVVEAREDVLKNFDLLCYNCLQCPWP